MPALKVLIKGLNKVVEFPADTPMEAIESSIKGGWNDIESISGLPMDTASRMERAKFLGFDPDSMFTHEHGYRNPTPEYEIQDIRAGDDTVFDGLFTFGKEPIDLDNPSKNKFLAKKHADHRDFDDAAYKGRDKVDKVLGEELHGFDDMTSEQKGTIRSIVREEESIEDYIDYSDFSLPEWMDEALYVDTDTASWEMQRIRGRVAKDLGFDAVDMKDETGISTLMLDTNGVRNVNASFNPVNKSGKGLLASVAGGAVGLGALAQSDKSAASQSASRLLQEGLIDQKSKAFNIPSPALNRLGLFLQRGPQSLVAEGIGRGIETLSLGRENELTPEEIRKRAIGVALDFL